MIQKKQYNEFRKLLPENKYKNFRNVDNNELQILERKNKIRTEEQFIKQIKEEHKQQEEKRKNKYWNYKKKE